MNVLPQIALQMGRPIDPVRFEQGYKRAQELFEAGADDSALTEALFRTLDWPLALIPAVTERFRREYRPALFEDTVPFVEGLIARGCDVYVLSNNNHTSNIIEALGFIRQGYRIKTESGFETRKHRPRLHDSACV